MSRSITWELTADVDDTSGASLVDFIDVETTLDADIKIASGETKTTVLEFGPGSIDNLKFLLVTANKYSENLTHNIGSGSTDIPLTGALLLVGEGTMRMVKMLLSGGDDGKVQFEFSNGEDSTVLVNVLAGLTSTSSES